MYRQYCLLPAPKHVLKMIISKFVVPVSDWRSVTRPNETTLSGVIKFSTSDNAMIGSDWFTVSRLPAIIPTFDLIWKLMRQMWLGVNFFVGSQAPSAKKSVSCLEKKYKKLGQCHPSSNKKTHKVRNENNQRYVCTRLSFP